MAQTDANASADDRRRESKRGSSTKRRLFGFVCILSGLVCILTGLVWAQSHATALLLVHESGGVRYEAMAFRGLLVVRDFRPWGFYRGFRADAFPLGDWPAGVTWYQTDDRVDVEPRGLWGFEAVRGKFHFFSLQTWHAFVDFRALSVPLWAVAMLPGLLPATWLFRRARRLPADAPQRRRLRRNVYGAGIACLAGAVGVGPLRAYTYQAVQPRWPLIAAICRGDLPSARRLIAGGADVRTADEGGRTALHWAALADTDGVTPLLEAARFAPEIVKMLLDRGANPNAASATGRTPLHEAAWFGNEPIAELLLSAGANPSAPDGDGLSPLTGAAGHDCPRLVALLLARGGDRTARDTAGDTPADVAAWRGKQSIWDEEEAETFRRIRRVIDPGSR